jgi:two-component system sensor histidine kinase GlrK
LLGTNMHLYYPKSFLKLVLVGLSLVALPTLFALISIAVAVDQLTRRSQTAVQQAAQATQASRRVSELIAAMERSARQFVILNDRGMLENYRAHRARLAQTVDSLSALPLADEQRAELAKLAHAEREVFGALADPSMDKARVGAAVARFTELSDLAQSIMARSNAHIDREIEALRGAGEDVRGMVFWQLLALIPVMIFLVVGSTLIVARPIREIDRAIRRMGEGEFATEVTVSGPEDLRHLGRQLDWLRRRMIELEQQRNRFLQHVSHELKTPLTALREGSELLVGGMAGRLNADQLEIAEILRQRGLQLQKLIEDLLNYGALQSQRFELTLASVNLKDVIDRAVAGQSVALRTKDLRLETRGIDVGLTADAEKLTVVMDNLLSNAIKFSPAGSAITLAVTQSATDIVIDVIDSGPGVPVSDKERVFEPFYSGMVVQDSRIKGTGLGLSIVKEYVLAHEGSVEMINAGSCGGHFRVRLPRVPGAASVGLT